MARGARKTTLEKLQKEYEEVKTAIIQYQESLKTLKEKEKILKEQIEIEEFKQIKYLLEDQDMTLDDLKAMIDNQAAAEQSA